MTQIKSISDFWAQAADQGFTIERNSSGLNRAPATGDLTTVSRSVLSQQVEKSEDGSTTRRLWTLQSSQAQGQGQGRPLTVLESSADPVLDWVETEEPNGDFTRTCPNNAPLQETRGHRTRSPDGAYTEKLTTVLRDQQGEVRAMVRVNATYQPNGDFTSTERTTEPGEEPVTKRTTLETRSAEGATRVQEARLNGELSYTRTSSPREALTRYERGGMTIHETLRGATLVRTTETRTWFGGTWVQDITQDSIRLGFSG